MVQHPESGRDGIIENSKNGTNLTARDILEGEASLLRVSEACMESS
jgi:hypothetical protein